MFERENAYAKRNLQLLKKRPNLIERIKKSRYNVCFIKKDNGSEANQVSQKVS